VKKSLVAFKNGRKLDPVSMIEWNRIMSLFPDGTKVTVTIENYKRKRSLSQNNYLHVILQYIADYTGEDLPSIKALMKENFGLREAVLDRNGNEMPDHNGEVLERLKSTNSYTTSEMTAFIDRIRVWAANYLDIHTPDAESYRNYNNPE
jgi:hypothetical protein